MSLSDVDLEDYVEKLRSLIYKQNDHKTSETDLLSLIENLTKELEMSKQREDCLRRNMTKILDSENADITTKYVSLKEQCDLFEKKNVDLTSEVDELKKRIIVETESQKQEYLRKFEEMSDKYKSQVIDLKRHIEDDRNSYETKEMELYNELQLAQAANALQCDEIESNLKRQLVDANLKLRNSQHTIRNLQMDLNNLRNQLTSQQTRSQPKHSLPEIRFQPLPVTSTTTRPMSFEESEYEDQDFFEAPPNRSVTPSSSTSTPLRKNSNQFNKIPLVFKEFNKPTSTKTPTVPRERKRKKLYDPTSFDESNFPTF